jgi:hypothetical protein
LLAFRPIDHLTIQPIIADMTDQNETAPEETEEAAQAEETEGPAVTNDEWARRLLCSDGNCIGVIGADGRCKECGKPYEGKLPAEFDAPGTAAADATRPDADDGSGEGAEQGTDEEGQDEAAPAPDDEWENRILCSDGNCIGVIGPDGRCKECGKPYEGE